jgi:hypothetical protein
MVSLVACTNREHQVYIIHRLTRKSDLHLTANFLSKKLPFAEGTIVNALVHCQAMVVAFMEPTLYAKQVACGALRLADLDAGLEIYHGAVECSA